MSDLLPQLSRDLAALAARLAPHLVLVRSQGAVTSGFVWRDGLIVTAEEPHDSDRGLAVTFADGTERPATLHGFDPATDVALLRVEGPTPPPVALDAATPRALGEIAVALGHGPDGAVAALGIVASAGPAWRSLRGGLIDARLRLDLRLPRGAEGSLVADADGRAYGMAVMGPRRATLVIPAATLERVAAHLLAHGRVARGYLGLGLQPVRIEGTDGPAALVTSVDPEGPARASGVRPGDIVVRLGGEALRGPMAFRNRLGPESVGQPMELGLLRGGEPFAVTLTVAERPAS